jgi:GDP-L-fucose synthase
VEIWGTGKVKREFLYVDDMASASIHVLALDKNIYLDNTESMLSHINVGTGIDCTIGELAKTIKEVVGFTGGLSFDATKPDGAARKLMDVSRIKKLGWEHETSLKVGLDTTYQWFLENEVGNNLRL